VKRFAADAEIAAAFVNVLSVLMDVISIIIIIIISRLLKS